MICPLCDYSIATVDYNGSKICQDCYNSLIEYKRKYYDKPPLGLTPHNVWVTERINEIKLAIDRYKNENLQIPVEWFEEYNKLVKENSK